MAKTTTPATVKTAQTYPEIEEIKEDIVSLRSNIVELTQHLKKDGMKQTKRLKDNAADQISELQKTGKEHLENLEGQVKQKPLQSVAIAFASGLVFSMLVGRR